MGWKTLALVALLGLAIALPACVTEPQKVANDQMDQAAVVGTKDTTALLTGMAAADYVFNLVDVTARLQAILVYFDDIHKLASANRTGFGAPKTPVPYQPGKTKPIEEGASKTWYALAGAAAMALLYRAAVTYLPTLAGPWATLANSLVTGLAKGRVDAENAVKNAEDLVDPNAVKALQKLLSTVQSEQSKSGILGFASRLMDKVETKLDIDHQVTLAAK